MIDRRIKSLPLFGRSLDLKFRQLPFPQFFAFSFQACKSFSFQFLHIQFRPITAHCRDSGLHRNHFSLTGRETHPETQVFSPGFETTPETVSIVFHRNSILHNSKIPERFRKYSRKINMPFPTLLPIYNRQGSNRSPPEDCSRDNSATRYGSCPAG